ncbi:MAG: DUF5060 domain-containing protein [Clostridiales bacterium]|nr:DUF5060 domain-containing protein [Clostridiales bacterium]
MKAVLATALTLLSLCAAARAGTVIDDVALSSDSVGQYQCLEITFQTTLKFENPFDPEEIDLRAVFCTPSGQVVEYPAFYQRPGRSLGEDFAPERNQQDYAFDYAADRYVFVPAEGDRWAVHFSWSEVGRYTFSILAQTKEGSWTLPCGSFSVTASDEPGPITQSEKNPSYLCYRDSGAQFIPLGMNAAQFYDTYGYNRILTAIAENGGNYARVWSGTDSGYNSLCIENWNYGPGLYNMDMADALEQVMLDAREKDVRVQLCLDSFSALSTSQQFYGQFQSASVYNRAFGGFIRKPDEFWSSEECKKDYKARLRYIMARCGWDTNIAVWELMNEINGTTGFNGAQKKTAAWCAEMRAYLRQIDPYQRAVGVSFADGDKLDRYATFLNACKLDYIQGHHYDAGDVAGTMQLLAVKAKAYSNLALIGEFGLSPDKQGKDPTHQYVHIAMWSGLMSGASNVPLYWYVDELVNSGDQTCLRPLRTFIDAFDFLREPMTNAVFSASSGLKAKGITAKNGTQAVLYVYNEAYRWAAANPAPVKNARVTLKKLAPGAFTITLWDTFTGEILETRQAQVASNGTLDIRFDTVARDAAVMVQGQQSAQSK